MKKIIIITLIQKKKTDITYIEFKNKIDYYFLWLLYTWSLHLHSNLDQQMFIKIFISNFPYRK